MDSPEVSVLRKTLFLISSELTDDEVQQLVYVCKDHLTVKQRQNIKDALRLFEVLEQKGIISEDNFTFLIKRMEDLQRYDLKEELLEIMPGPKTSTTPAPQPQGRVLKASGAGDYGPFRSQLSSSAQQGNYPSPLNPATLKTPAHFYPLSLKAIHAEAGRQGERGSVVNLTSSRQETRIHVTGAASISPQFNARGFISKPDKTKRETSPIQNTYSVAKVNIVREGQQSLPEYRMDRNPRGLCMIINNVKFKGLLASKPRPGSDIDAGKLDNLFNKLHFKVEVKENLTASAMLDLFKRVSLLDHSYYDCFACCILTHGALGQLCGADSETLEIQQILGLFTGVSCSSLTGKPKLFFIQACRGNTEQEGVEVVETDDEPRGLGTGIPQTLPNEADFLLSYATVPGYVSYRGRSEGSWYVSALVDQIDKLHNTTDILNILTAVNKTLCNKDAPRKAGIRKQVAAPSYTLEKVLYLRSLEQ